MNTEFIRYMKKAGAFVRPKDMTRYSYNGILWQEEKMVGGGSTRIGSSLDVATHKDNS